MILICICLLQQHLLSILTRCIELLASLKRSGTGPVAGIAWWFSGPPDQRNHRKGSGKGQVGIRRPRAQSHRSLPAPAASKTASSSSSETPTK